MDQSGISKLDLKRCNRMQILKLLRQQGPTSRIDISRSLQLTRAAVTIITNEMIETGILIKKDDTGHGDYKPTRGRKKVLIDIAPNFRFVFGVVVDRNVVSIGLSNLCGDVLGKRSEKITDIADVDRLIRVIIHHVQEIKQESCLSDAQILGLGLCLPTKSCSGQTNEPELKQLARSLERQLGITVVSQELIHALALADIDFGYRDDFSKKPTDLVFIRYRKDITASVVINNTVFSGTHGNAGNLPHMIMQPLDGEECPICGNRGCLHSLISAGKLSAEINAIYSPSKTPKLYAALGPGEQHAGEKALNQPELFVDDSVKQIVSDACRWLAAALVTTVQMLDPDRIVLFGRMFENAAFSAHVRANLELLLPPPIMQLLAVSQIQTRAIYLAGCSVAVRELFIQRGGLEPNELRPEDTVGN